MAFRVDSLQVVLWLWLPLGMATLASPTILCAGEEAQLQRGSQVSVKESLRQAFTLQSREK